MNKKKLISISLISIFLLALCFAGYHKAYSQQKNATSCYSQNKFSGEVTRGQSYQIDIGEGLIFCLEYNDEPTMEGWNIRIRPKDQPRDNYGWQLNPPYRGYNSTHINISYGHTARQAVEGSRKLLFPLDEADARKAEKIVKTLLWDNVSEVEFHEGQKALENMRSGKAVFKIIDSEIGEGVPENNNRERIEWLRFEVIISLPCHNQNNS